MYTRCFRMLNRRRRERRGEASRRKGIVPRLMAGHGGSWWLSAPVGVSRLCWASTDLHNWGSQKPWPDKGVAGKVRPRPGEGVTGAVRPRPD